MIFKEASQHTRFDATLHEKTRNSTQTGTEEEIGKEDGEKKEKKKQKKTNISKWINGYVREGCL